MSGYFFKTDDERQDAKTPRRQEEKEVSKAGEELHRRCSPQFDFSLLCLPLASWRSCLLPGYTGAMR
jgi:hypothetical protein